MSGGPTGVTVKETKWEQGGNGWPDNGYIQRTLKTHLFHIYYK